MPKEKEPEKRELTAFYLTKQDKEYITELSQALAFKSPSRLMTAIIERLIIGGFSPLVFLKLGLQFSKLSGRIPSQGFYFGVRPLPPLIDDRNDPTEEEVIAEMERYIKQHKKGKQP